MVIVSVGVRPNSELGAAAGLALGPRDAIAVDAHMRTSDPDIYAAGDCVTHFHIVLDDTTWIPLAPSANKGGRIAGDNISGSDDGLSRHSGHGRGQGLRLHHGGDRPDRDGRRGKAASSGDAMSAWRPSTHMTAPTTGPAPAR